MKPSTAVHIPLILPSPPLGGKDKGEGEPINNKKIPLAPPVCQQAGFLKGGVGGLYFPMKYLNEIVNGLECLV
jgi:hypothetical protein